MKIIGYIIGYFLLYGLITLMLGGDFDNPETGTISALLTTGIVALIVYLDANSGTKSNKK